MLLLYSVAIFLGAALLFLVQPMIARMVLPLLGGTPSVWNTCMVFFQAALLGGYAYSHWTSSRLGLRRQPLAHIAVVLAPLVVIFCPLLAGGSPLSLPDWPPPVGGSPIPWLLGVLALTIGLPFLVASTGGPLLQRWFAATPHRAAKDPYFLYAASNLGSLLALLTYPFMLEPALTLSGQRWLWAVGYTVFAALTIACAVVVARTGRTAAPAALPIPAAPRGQTNPAKNRVEGPSTAARSKQSSAPPAKPPAAAIAVPTPETEITPLVRLRWIALAFVPSSLMLGVTQFFSTDIAAFPLLWIVPLSIYLITFVLAFSRRTLIPVPSVAKIMPFLVIGLPIASMVGQRPPIIALLVLHLGAMFLCCMLCHGRLAAERPSAKHLTEFYMLISVGGVLGGIFNALVAPLIFKGVYEYPIAIVLACLLKPPAQDEGGEGQGGVSRRTALILDLALPLGLAVVAIGADSLIALLEDPISRALSPGDFAMIRLGADIGLPAVICYFLNRRPLRFALGVGALFLLATMYGSGGGGRVVYRERTFFGVYTVEKYRDWLPSGSPGPRFIRVKHGTTLHGIQFAPVQENWTPDGAGGFVLRGEQPVAPDLKNAPLSYYGPQGPVGDIFKAFGGTPLFSRVGLVGLGAGSLASYARPGERFTFFEIDPAVQRIAEDTRYFTYLSDARATGAAIDIVLGDGRLSLAREPDGAFGMILLDAFSSDAIPVHLMTKEAVALYLRKLAPGGFLAFHVSNNFIDLHPVLIGIAEDLGLCVASGRDYREGSEMAAQGLLSSYWVILAHRPADLAPILKPPTRWEFLQRIPGERRILWTDDYSDIVSVFKWSKQ